MKEKIETPRMLKELVPLFDFHKEVCEESYLQGYSICDLLIEEEELPYLHLDSCYFKNCVFENCTCENIDMVDLIFEN